MCAKKEAAPKKKGTRPLKKATPKKAKSQARPTSRRGESHSPSSGANSDDSPTATPPAVIALAGGGGSIQRVFNCNKSPEIPGELIVGVHEIGPAARAMRAGPIPDSLDLRANWWDVGDQGETGACVGWAVGDGLMRYYWTKKNNKLGTGERLSVRYVWMGAKETDEFGTRPTTFLETAGTSIRAALELFKKHGCVKEPLLPLSGGLSLLTEDAFFLQAQEYVIRTDYANIQVEEGVWKRWLFREGPIAARLRVDHTFMNANVTNATLENYVPFGNPEAMGHAVLIVGYTDRDEFIIRNSWGSVKWGDAGFALASFDYVNAAFTESFGVYFTL